MSDKMSDSQIDRLITRLTDVLSKLHPRNFKKALLIINSIPEKCSLDKKSYDHALQKKADKRKLHPTRPVRGEIYNVLISQDNVGTELIGNHLCVIISNKKKNLYSEKVNVVPIEGDGTKIDPINNIQLTNDDLEDGHLDKNPSKIIAADIMTIDKARLDIRIGKLKDEKLKEIIQMVKDQLGIS
ncbi:type II toxin-antitoxin system PemK/MazF family toxin [Ammoniphilus resinae]|uniref:mRNA-degrading endonuclease toxin of MazEF toxin-antitoxin module n=1 Tax=Ammoniphilus resinae TaxID=861532 RepID=A0ABS4GX80_9BACL|nr:type II toxin-antitoxin system PemK/MazF family toxin [Ammoniphilus resinae]MBP1934879.1 mRNA-degrading endonuclease toxin of MazEF toxin-antitoxin module [Ammoniphilus resinae]